jgi:tetratricopeptide (TPR) repeat protein
MDSVETLVQEGIRLAAMGGRAEAVGLFTRALEMDPRNETAWLWLAELADGDDERVECLEAVVDINPENKEAAHRLAALGERAIEVEPALSDTGSLEPEAGVVERPEPASEQAVLFCWNCGTENPGEGRFCSGCGARLGVPVGPEVANVPVATGAASGVGIDDPGKTRSGSAERGSLRMNTTGIKVGVLLLVCAAAFMGYINTFEGIVICLATVAFCEIIKRM